MERVTADSNIWVSGLNWRGKPHELLNLAGVGQIELAVSEAILEEVSRILHDKLGWSDERVSDACAEIASFTKRIAPREALDVVKSDASDNRILECALAAGFRGGGHWRPALAGARGFQRHQARESSGLPPTLEG